MTMVNQKVYTEKLTSLKIFSNKKGNLSRYRQFNIDNFYEISFVIKVNIDEYYQFTL